MEESTFAVTNIDWLHITLFALIGVFALVEVIVNVIGSGARRAAKNLTITYSLSSRGLYRIKIKRDGKNIANGIRGFKYLTDARAAYAELHALGIKEVESNGSQ